MYLSHSIASRVVSIGLSRLGNARPGRHADRLRSRPRLEGLEDRCLLSITEFPVPTPNATTWSIASGSDGNLWFTERDGNKVGMINPTTHAISDFPVPTASSWPIGITAGPDGNLWFTEDASGKIGVINPTTHAIAEYTVPSSNSQPWAVTSGPDANLWFTDIVQNSIGMINPTTHTITEFAIPTINAYPYGIATGSDGNLWFTEYSAGQIGMINPATHAISEFPIPRSGPAPDAITAGPDGNLWFTDDGNNGTGSDIGMINPTTHVITEFPVTPYGIDAWDGITSGPDGNLWFTDIFGAFGTISPMTHVLNEYVVPGSASAPLGITSNPDGNIWFADQVNGIGVDYLKNLVVAQQPPASVAAGSGFGLTVQAEDSSGNLITSLNGAVTVALAANPGGSTLGGTLTVTASSGVATFSGLTLNKAASGYTLVVTTSGLGQGVTNAMTVTPAAATQLVITQQPPATVKVSTPFALKASIEDQYGNVVTTASSTVSVAFANNPTGATLGGTLAVIASQGVASFTNLSINKIGSGYTLRLSSSGLSSSVTNAINVTRTGHSPSPLTAPTVASVPDRMLAPLVFDTPDLWDGLRLKKRSRS
jgi:streptogramin lyase